MKNIYFFLILVLLFFCGGMPAQFSKVYDFEADNLLTYPNRGRLETDGTYLFGITTTGGAYNQGGIYRIKLDGTNYSEIFSFNGTTDGATPYANIIISGTTLYGTTYLGGTYGFGTIFQINTDGTGFTVLYNFNNNSPNFDGRVSWSQMMKSGTVLYGVLAAGGTLNHGTIFKYDLGGGGFSKLHDFDNTNGKKPFGTLTLYGSTLFGTTYDGGTSGIGVIFKILTDGTGFVKLHDQTVALGQALQGGVVLIGNTLYGTSYFGGTFGVGLIYSMDTTGGSYTVLKSFTGPPESDRSGSNLVVSGTVLYGSTSYGGATQSSGNGGTIFKYDLGGSSGN